MVRHSFDHFFHQMQDGFIDEDPVLPWGAMPDDHMVEMHGSLESKFPYHTNESSILEHQKPDHGLHQCLQTGGCADVLAEDWNKCYVEIPGYPVLCWNGGKDIFQGNQRKK